MVSSVHIFIYIYYIHSVCVCNCIKFAQNLKYLIHNTRWNTYRLIPLQMPMHVAQSPGGMLSILPADLSYQCSYLDH